VSTDNSGRSSLERHNEEMKPRGFSKWLFGESGGTPIPMPSAPSHSHHGEPQVSEAFKGFFKDASDSTEAEYQKMRRERTLTADISQINVPPGYVPVTFVEDDVIIIAEKGKNLRKLALENNIEIYGDVMKLLNCRGLVLCTSCRVAVDPNDAISAPTAMEKVHLIRDNPKYRLSCQCEVTGPVKVSTKPAKDYGFMMRNFVRNASLFGVFSVIMILLLLVIGFDVVGKWF